MWSEFASARDAFGKSVSSLLSKENAQGDLSEMAAAMTAWIMKKKCLFSEEVITNEQILCWPTLWPPKFDEIGNSYTNKNKRGLLSIPSIQKWHQRLTSSLIWHQPAALPGDDQAGSRS